MSNTLITLQNIANLCSTHSELMPLAGVGGYVNEPFLSLANDAISDLLSSPNDWKFNRKEMPMLVTCPNKQDYQFAGACAFTLGASSQGWAIGLASNSAIVEVGNTVTVTTLEQHRLKVGDVVYMTGNTVAAYNSIHTDTGSSSAWSGGWTILTVTATTFTFTHATSALAVSGAPGITDFGWAQDASMVNMIDNSSPQFVDSGLKTYRELPVTSRLGNPQKVAIMHDNGDGTLKIRFSLVPSTTTWGANIIYQAQAPLKVALTDNWAPFPDSFSALYRQALIYRMYRYMNSPRADGEYVKLQQEIMKAQGSDDSEQSSIYVTPEEPLIDFGSYGWGW